MTNRLALALLVILAACKPASDAGQALRVENDEMRDCVPELNRYVRTKVDWLGNETPIKFARFEDDYTLQEAKFILEELGYSAEIDLHEYPEDIQGLGEAVVRPVRVDFKLVHDSVNCLVHDGNDEEQILHCASDDVIHVVPKENSLLEEAICPNLD